MKKGRKKVSKKKVAKKSVSKKAASPKRVRKQEDISLAQFGLGIALCLFAAGLMFFRLMSLPIQLAIGVVGILLIATSPFGPLRFAKD